MRSAAASLDVQILTEDGEGAYPALKSLLTKMIQHEAYWVSAQALRYVDAPEQVREDFRGSSWHGKKDVRARDKRDLIARSLATFLARGAPVVLVIHVDADLPWSSGERRPANHARVLTLLAPAVRALLEQKRLGDAAERLVVLVPYAHIESWYFQNTSELRRWYARHLPGPHPDLDHIERWEADPGLLDEACEPASKKPKQLMVIGSRHNTALADGFPVETARAAHKSFAAAYETLLAVPGLKDWIAAQKPPWASETP